MREILADLVAEQQALDQLLQRAPERDWKRKVPGGKWTVQDTISHLAWSEGYAMSALDGDRKALAKATKASTVDELNELGVREGQGKRPQEIIEWWRHNRAAVVEALSHRRPADRIPWFVSDMSARTFATSRLMETWAHGLDVHAALEREVVDTIRIRHVAWLGWATLPYAFAAASEDYPAPIRLELVGPAYSSWVFGPPDTEQVIKGSAGEWCRLAVGRMSARSIGNLTAIGDTAEKALRLARAFP